MGIAPGFTLVELLVSIAVAAILATLAAPSFRELAADARRNRELQSLVQTLELARAEALARGVPASICASADGRACRGAQDWSDGWLAFADARAPRGARTPDEPVLAVGAGADGIALRANRAVLEFQPVATAASTATLTACDWRGARAARAVVVSRSGRIRVSARDADGEALRCE